MSSLLSKQDRILLTEISEELSTEEIVKYYRFDEEDMERIKKHRSDYNKIGFALYLGFIRHKGWALTENTKIPRKIIDFVAKQLELDPAEFHKYNVTSSTSFSHYKEIRKAYKYKPLESKFNLELESFMYEYIFKSEDSFYLVSTFMDECRNKKILLPSILVIEDFISKLINKMEEFSIKEINSYIHPQQIDFMDNLLESNDDNPAIITWLRFSSGKSSPEEIVEIVKKIEKIEEIGLKIDKDKIPTYMVEKYIKFGQRYDPYSLKRFTPQKRYAILSVFLINLHQELIDRMVLIHDVKVNNVFSKIRKTQEKNLKIHKKVSINAISDYVELGEYIINSENTTESTDKDTSFHFKINNGTWEKLKKSIELAKLLKENDSTDSIEMINKYYTSFRKYSPLLLKKLDITGTTEPNTKLLNAINIIKELNDSKKINLPEDVDISFTNKKWQKIINRKNGTEKRHYFELAVLNELRNKVRSGDISISGSKSYMNFEEYLVPKEQWELEKKATRLTAPISCEEYLDLAEKKLDKLLKWYSKNYKSLEEIIGEDDKIHLKRMEKTNSEESRVLSQELYKLVPKISLQDLLLEISNITGFKKNFLNLTNNKEISTPEELMVLIFAIMGIGTNVGLSNIAASLNNISYKQLSDASEWRLLEENLYGALCSMVDFQMKEPISKWWGDGTTSSSDGMRVVTVVDSLNSSYNPHFGFEKGLTIYRFVNDKYAAFYSIITNTNIRDAVHIIDGILKYASEAKIHEHYTDTAGYTDQIFALMSIMGFRFAPRLRNLSDLKLYSFDKNKYPNLKNLIPGKINKDLIRENYDTIMRLSHSIYEGKVSSGIILGKLGSYSRNNRVANALKEIGKIEKTIFILEYASDPNLRKRIQVGLNKGEAMNNLARNIFFGKKGNLWEHELQNQIQKSSCLNIIIDSIVLWNTRYLSKAWKHHKKENPDIEEKLLEHVSPLNWEHINFLGNYSLDFETEYEEDHLRKLNIEKD